MQKKKFTSEQKAFVVHFISLKFCKTKFQNIVFFCFQGNFVPDNDADLANIIAEYDTIIAFSVTKWIHLNFGDQGLKRFFKRIYRTLLPGGRLILEPQPWSSYRLKRRMTVRRKKRFFFD
jgi:7SK snRNA methylphosphate capping enzyme